LARRRARDCSSMLLGSMLGIAAFKEVIGTLRSKRSKYALFSEYRFAVSGEYLRGRSVGGVSLHLIVYRYSAVNKADGTKIIVYTVFRMKPILGVRSATVLRRDRGCHD